MVGRSIDGRGGELGMVTSTPFAGVPLLTDFMSPSIVLMDDLVFMLLLPTVPEVVSGFGVTGGG